MRVRAATIADQPAILAIYNHAVLHSTCTAEVEPRTLAEQHDWFAQRVENNYPVLVAEGEDGQIVGWSSLSRYHLRYGYRFTAETSVYVAPERRGQGIGTLLLPPLIAAAEPLGLHVLIASIDAENEASIRLHARFGFAKVGHLREVFTKFDRWLDVVYMERLVSASTPRS